ncbi:hypothetical protein [Acetobacter garciniae]|uniref:hypothetical protein n=1 Tax=Acetobacter garciniae TaxID=2817435 RepID=UPI001E446BF4|nr:hypothetical protein [Acetobacter garciniae]
MMSLSFPDWMPLWGQLLVLACGVVFGLAFLMMPFAVFGVKGRLAELSFQIEELQAELRSHVLRGDAPARADVPGAAPTTPAERGGMGFVPLVEEVRPPAPARPAAVEAPARDQAPALPPREVPVFPELRAPRVSDAYDARPGLPPEPQAQAYVPPPVRRMPWHEVEPERPETGEEIMRRQRAPDANQPPYRPDFSRDQLADGRLSGTSGPAMGAPLGGPFAASRADEEKSRVEPVLKWPPTASPDHRGE